jgi:hypothetical protein
MIRKNLNFLDSENLLKLPPSRAVKDCEPLVTRSPATKGRVPFGFQQNPCGRTEHEAEVKWLKRIVELADSGLSGEQITRRNNKEDHESRRAGKWSRTAVWRTLKRFKKKSVTNSFCNDPSLTSHSVTPPTIVSESVRTRICPRCSTEYCLPSNSKKRKALQNNDFGNWLPGLDSNQEYRLQRAMCYRYTTRE